MKGLIPAHLVKHPAIHPVRSKYNNFKQNLYFTLDLHEFLLLLLKHLCGENFLDKEYGPP